MASEYEHYLEAIGEEVADEEAEETRRLSGDSLRPHTQEPLDAPVPGQEAEDDVRDSDSPLEMTEADGETVVRRNSSSLAPITSLPIRPATPSDEEAEAAWEGAGAAVDSKDVVPEGSEQGSDLGLEDSAVDFYLATPLNGRLLPRLPARKAKRPAAAVRPPGRCWRPAPAPWPRTSLHRAPHRLSQTRIATSPRPSRLGTGPSLTV